MKELTEELLVTQIFGFCIAEPQTIEGLTNKIYKNLYAKNIVRVYQCVEILMKRGILIPVFKDRTLLFRVDDKIIGRNGNGIK